MLLLSVLMFLRVVTSTEIMKKAEYYKPFIDKTEHTTLFEVQITAACNLTFEPAIFVVVSSLERH